MSAADLLNPDVTAPDDAPSLGGILEGTVVDQTAGRLTVTVAAMDAGLRTKVVRGFWPDAGPADPVWLLELPDGGLLAVGWEPA